MNGKNPKTKNIIWLIGGGIILAAAIKIWLIVGDRVPFNSDEAVVALMARHILQGEMPLFFYGQSYMGSLDAFLIAFGFLLFGEHVWVIRLVQSLLYIGVLCTTAWLGKKAFNSWLVGGLALSFLAVPTVNVTLYTTVSLGGYGEALLLGNLMLLIGIQIGESIQQEQAPGSVWLWMLFGFLAGLGVWAFGLSLIYSLPLFIYLFVLSFIELRKYSLTHSKNIDQQSSEIETSSRSTIAAYLARFGMMALGALIGSLPMWIFALQNGLKSLLFELGGGAIAGVENLPWVFSAFQHLSSLFLLGSTVIVGARPPWDVIWLGLPLLPFVFIFWMAVLVYIVSCFRGKNPQKGAQALLVGVMLTLLAAFIFTPFGADPSGRYFVPLAVPLALFAGSLIVMLQERVGYWAYALVGLVLVFNFWGTIQSAFRFPPGITTQFYAPTQVDHRYDAELVAFLEEHDETRGYGNYWVTYPLAFLSDENLIFIPRLPYHLDFRYTERDDRYAPYGEWVAQADRTTYITTNHPDLNDRLSKSFSELGVEWQQIQIGDYTVFYELSRPVRPQEIGLGTTTVP
jgi:4-amino-4-deoxy-L-arabinose transferase-like glycosyltransferase